MTPEQQEAKQALVELADLSKRLDELKTKLDKIVEDDSKS